MEELSINELPQWSPWPARITGLTPWQVPSRTVEKIDKEYDKEKYAAVLEGQRRLNLDVEGARALEYGIPEDGQMCFAIGEQIFKGPPGRARRAFYDVLEQNLLPHIRPETTVVELGCGFGYNMWLLAKQTRARRWLGGEYSANAVELARRLYAKQPEIHIEPFDFYADRYRLFDGIEGPCVVYTSHAIEQLPSAKQVVEVLSRIPSVERVVHFEPVRELQPTNLLGMLRRRYLELNDYNRDLKSVLEAAAGRVEIESIKPNLVGMNPLCPTSVITWRPIR